MLINGVSSLYLIVKWIRNIIKLNNLVGIHKLSGFIISFSWKTEEVKIMRYPDECRRQWKPKQEKLGWQKQKEEEVREEAGKKREEKEKKQKRKQKREKTMKVKRVAEEWEIWDEEEEMAKSEVEAKKLVLEKFHR